MTAAFFIKGQPVQIDQSDWDAVRKHSWYLMGSGDRMYPAATINRKKVRLHRFLLGSPIVDHVNGDAFDNRRENLRACSYKQNSWNARKLRGATTTSQFKGVSKRKGREVFDSYITCNEKRIRFGRFKDEITAALCYDIAAVSLFGEFAKPNFTLVEAALVHPESFKLAVERCKAKGILPTLNSFGKVNG